MHALARDVVAEIGMVTSRGELRLVPAERRPADLPSAIARANLQPVNTYLPIKTGIDRWTVEWSVSGVTIGHVHGIYGSEMEAILAAFIMNERARRGLLSPSRSDAHKAAPGDRPRS
jgi:hypothetical protein